MSEVAIKCQGIKKHYGENETRIDALRGIDLEVYSNQLTLIVGPSGSGKSTLLSIITNILTPDAGKLFLLGQDILTMTEDEKSHFCQKNLGIVFQALYLIPTLTVVENITVPLLIAGHNEKEANEKAVSLLEKLSIGHRANDMPTNLSRGQQQRVAICRSMINDSKIIVCDEPTSALDQASGFASMTLLKELSQHENRAVVVVTHDHRIFSFGDRVVQMNDGQIIPG